MADNTFEFETRLRALETRFVRTGALDLGSTLAEGGNTNGCGTNGCTNCVANEMMNVLLPGEDRPLSGREIVKMLAIAREKS